MSDSIKLINPTNGALIEELEYYSDSRVDQALDRVSKAQKSWRNTSYFERAALLKKLADLLERDKEKLAALATLEMGKLEPEAQAEVQKCALVCRYYAEHGEQFLADTPWPDDEENRTFTAWQPLGTVLAVMPWNFPFWQVYRCAAPAIMAGNTVVLKHASNVSKCALAMHQLFAEAADEKSLFETVLVSGKRASALLNDSRIQAASVTGSEVAGMSVASAAGDNLKPTVLELGGSDPFIVLDLEHKDSVLDNAIKSRFQNAGQSCIAAKRFIVLDNIYDEFVESFVDRCESLKLGDPNKQGTDLAPMARADLRDELHDLVSQATAHGATLLCGGEPAPGDGFYYPATVVTDIQENMALYREEAFGPVASVYRVANCEAAIQLANDSRFGLGGSVWGADLEVATDVARKVESGAVYVNRMMASDPRLPFGGIKYSGYGRELSKLGIREFVNAKTISVTRLV